MLNINSTIHHVFKFVFKGSTNVSKRAKLKRMVPSFMSSPAFQPVASTLWVDSAITDSYSGPILTKKNRKRRERDSASFPANHARSVRARTMQMFWYSYFEKGCRTKWALDNPERQYGIWLIHGSEHCSCGTYIYCFPLALADIRPWPFVPFFQISLKNSELKTTYNTFRDCRRHFFREPFSKKLYTTQIPGWLFHWNTLIRLLLHFVFLELFLLITSLCFFSVRAMNTISSPLGRKFS